MANPLIPYEGYPVLIKLGIGAFAGGANGGRIKLFANDYTPSLSTVWADFVEPAFVGYAPQVPTVPIDQGIAPTGVNWWRFPPVVFLMTAIPMQVVYGYWVDVLLPATLSRKVVWAKRFDNPFLFTGPGVSLPVILTPGFRQGQ